MKPIVSRGTRRPVHLFVGGLLLVAGCTSLTGTAAVGVGAPSGGVPENTAPAVDAVTDPAHPGIEACGTGDVTGDLAIVGAFEESMHELVVCGGLSARFSVAFFDVLFSASTGTDAHPAGFVYLGDGRYKSGDVMDVVLTLPHDTSFGSAGDPIPFDIFDPSNYFADFTITASASIDLSGEARTSLTVDFSETGPGFELLGLTPTAEGSITIDFDAMVETLGSIRMNQDIVVEDVRGSVTVAYHVLSEGVPLRNLVFAAGPAAMNIVDASVVDGETGQTLDVTDFAMEFSGGSVGTMDGHVDFQVRGGGFDYDGGFVYPHRKDPDVSLSCP